MKKIKFFIILIGLIAFLNACSNVKEGLTGSKKNNKDEFLVKKKNPLVQPPNFDELPVPKSEISEEEKLINQEDQDIEKLLEGYNVESEKVESDENIKTIEESILKKIYEN